jgi:hypothetical protein
MTPTPQSLTWLDTLSGPPIRGRAAQPYMHCHVCRSLLPAVNLTIAFFCSCFVLCATAAAAAATAAAATARAANFFTYIYTQIEIRVLKKTETSAQTQIIFYIKLRREPNAHERLIKARAESAD